jgi:D-proline reductase (dithiol) PrdB
MTDLMAPKLYPRQPIFAAPGLIPLRKPISQSTVGIFTSAGVQRRGEPLLAETNDLGYRMIDRATPLTELVVAHQTPVRKWALEDLNVAFPRDRLVELEAERTIGRLAPQAISMVGSITKFTELLQQTVHAIKAEFDRQEVDLVFLFPF